VDNLELQGAKKEAIKEAHFLKLAKLLEKKSELVAF
jgi:hypothetical protein